MYYSMAEMSVAEMSVGRSVRGQNVGGQNVLAETSVAKMSVAEMSEHRHDNICVNNVFLSHLLIARCDIGVQLSVRSLVRPSVCPWRPQFMSRCLLCSSDSWEYETLHSNYP